MSDLTLPEPMLPEPPVFEAPRRGRRIVWPALASLLLHGGLLAFLLWQPPPDSVEAASPPAINVELVPPPEAASASAPPPSEEPAEEPAGEAPAEAAAETPAETSPAEAPPPEPAAEASAPETPAEAGEPETLSEASGPGAAPESGAAVDAASEPPQGSEAAAKAAPIPLPRPKVRGLTAPSDAAQGAPSAPTADIGAIGEGTAADAESEGPDVATLELGAPRSAERFYLEAMLSMPSLAPARDMLKTLPPEKRLAQTCNIEALAQIGNAGEGFAPDVVMAEAYALSEMTGTRLVASGAIFRSLDKWYGFAFDCTLSDDLTTVTAFSYRLGADVTDAVLARLTNN